MFGECRRYLCTVSRCQTLELEIDEKSQSYRKYLWNPGDVKHRNLLLGPLRDRNT